MRKAWRNWATTSWTFFTKATAAPLHIGKDRTNMSLALPVQLSLARQGSSSKKSNTQSIQDVEFVNGVLSMPLFRFHDQTKMELLNLMAFEWLQPDAKNDVRSYISFLDSIIESEIPRYH